MKQLIIMISMILLGIAISGTVLSFQTTADTVAKNTNSTILSQVATTAAINN